MGQMSLVEFMLHIANGVTPAIELVIQNPETDEILLIPRDDEDFLKCLHFPGSPVQQGESVFNACRRIARNEAGVNISWPLQIGIRNFKDLEIDVRHFKELIIPNHFLGLVFTAKMTSKSPINGVFMSVMPNNILDSHKAVWEIFYKWMLFGGGLNGFNIIEG